MKRLWIGLSILVVIALGVFLFMKAQGPLPMLVSRQDPPKIHLDSLIHDLGTVVEGVEVPYTLTISNIGGKPLIISDVNTSCGCTLLNLKDKVIEPGKKGELEVIMDTSMKQGPVRKTVEIQSNDPVTPTLSVVLSANVLPNMNKPVVPETNMQATQPSGSDPPDTPTATQPDNPHANLDLAAMKPAQGPPKLFTGRCASCHVDNGVGKFGQALFEADCAMCHGINGQGNADNPNSLAPVLIPRRYDDPQVYSRLKHIIEEGSSHPSMPGFLDAHQGPLSQAQIDSLLVYLKTQSQQVTEQTQASQ